MNTIMFKNTSENWKKKKKKKKCWILVITLFWHSS